MHVHVHPTVPNHANMDPLSAIGAAGSILGIIDVVSRSIKTLMGLQSRYKRVGLKLRLLIGQLSTLKAALNQINDLIETRLDGVSQNQQLVTDLAISLDCCEAVISVLDDQLCAFQRSKSADLDPWSKTQFLWGESDMTDYQNLLNNQINSLNLLLTAIQWLVPRSPGRYRHECTRS